MKYNGTFCCDRHHDGFRLQDFLPGPLDPAPVEAVELSTVITRNQYRPTASQEKLAPLLKAWRRKEYLNDDLRAVYPEYLILSDQDMKSVVQLRPDSDALASPSMLSLHLGQTADWERSWARPLHSFLIQFNTVNPISLKRPRSYAAPASKAKRTKASEIEEVPRLTFRIRPLRDVTNSPSRRR